MGLKLVHTEEISMVNYQNILLDTLKVPITVCGLCCSNIMSIPLGQMIHLPP